MVVRAKIKFSIQICGKRGSPQRNGDQYYNIGEREGANFLAFVVHFEAHVRLLQIRDYIDQ